MMHHSAFKQGSLNGLCGPYGIANALSLLFPGRLSLQDAGALAHGVAHSLPCGFHTVLSEGTDRQQMERMLAAALDWTRARGWPGWTYKAAHPASGLTAEEFWARLAADLTPGTAALVGFGDHDGSDTPYEPHWTCIESITDAAIHLRDSDEYDVVLRSATAVRPEAGWEIEDCFLFAQDRAAGAGSVGLWEPVDYATAA
jgi:hypothetical protein